MDRIGDVAVEPASASDGPLLARLLQLYLHDFSEFAPVGTPHGEVDAEGLFPYGPGLDGYWREPDRFPVLIRAGGRVAGFASVNGWPQIDEAVDHALAEFFVLRKYRRKGVGRRAAKVFTHLYPGRWQVGIASYNRPALAFWRTMAHTMPGATERQGPPDRWNGPVLCFATVGTG